MRHRLLLSLTALCGILCAQDPPPLTLDRAIEEALASNLDLAAARYEIGVAEARQITAGLRPNPVASISADHLDLLGTGFNSTNNAGPNEYAMRTDFVLERGGKRTARIGLAAAEKSVAELRFRDAMRRLILEVESAFVDAQLAHERVRLARENLQSLNALVTINTERVRAGDLAGVELERSRVAAMQYETAVRQTELQLRETSIRLQLLLGKAGTAEVAVAAGPMRREAGGLSLDDLRRTARSQRPDLLSLRAGEARNQADLRLQLAQGKIDYTTGVEYRRQQGANGTGNTLGFFVSAPIPLFNRNQGEVARAQREAGQAAALIRALELRIDSEVTAAWQEYTTARGLAQDIERNMIGRAKEVRDTTEYSYRRGEASLVEFLDAQRAFNDVMQSYNDARASFAKSLYLIDSVTAAPPQATMN